MANFLSVVENRTWHTHTLSDPVDVIDGEDIVEITTIIENAEASLINIAATFSAAGKLYYVDSNGNENYLTDPNQNWPAKFTIIATLFLKKGETIGLRYSATCTMHHLYVTHGAGVF